MLQLPVTVTSGKQTFEIKGSMSYTKFEGRFWEELVKGVNQIAEEFPKDMFGPITEEEEMHLKLGSALLPKIWGQDD